ncbi:MAG: taurine dioxygenase [Rhodospirillaceae bacterium]|jgi:taurine dioxygenase|nr:taurine dioxygenase [Rhodospirillaceae bacterium]MBT4691484.1 taurine dioxygenase [Rhodospirillaceae bacterium]MBT5082987.1 taurine dioxygenase [Rhodospirillaceae bacterium]MBT5524431.1 taurine dioxygenase [Rhodospirillaceae bacterium]MBT5878773.1 taurine dioxygenase [Rhodospirillaceae bacterium]
MLKNSKLEIRQLAGALGAEILGADLSQDIDGGTFEKIFAALMEYGMVVIREQDITPAQHKAFCQRIGDPLPVPFVKTLDDHPEIIAVIKEADERTRMVFGGTWHTDFSFLAAPPKASCLYAREIPSFGGDTLFASMTKAYEALSPGMKALLKDMKVVHSGRRSYGPVGTFAKTQLNSVNVTASEEGDAEVLHPAVVVIPESGKRSLFINDIYAIRFDGMTEAESAPLLNFLCEQARRPENLCRLDWQPGSLALWDNRTTMHYAVDDYDGQRREMHRVTIAGIPLEGVQ